MTLRVVWVNEVSPMSSRNVRLPTPDSVSGSWFDPKQLLAPVRFVGFWLAVALPLVYLPLLAGGLSGWQTTTFVGLFTLNVLSLIVGHNYGRDD